MKKQLLLISFTLFLASFSLNGTENKIKSSTQETKVTICTGNSATKYHKTNKCRGLNACKGEKKTVTMKEAEKWGRTKCKICYKQ
ncbi:hypothetical protein D0T49_03685 [Paludibacter sp. 221]|uniref:hypothetical protein n=1 Tax=Paludibacter sp. 221 TaxID=2302939 RepID=UPI0013D3C063|nr:hypothetical protein [Paludibacter sp. 221]NDV46142.1 hypothetical protein [Paludibacter sp. 221]